VWIGIALGIASADASAMPRGGMSAGSRPSVRARRVVRVTVQMAAIAGPTAGTSNAEASGMDILTWLIVGLIAGVLASLIVGSAGGIIVDIVIGIVGAFVGGWLFTAAGWHVPFAGLAGTIFVAFIGAVILLVLVHLIRRRPLP
jgi:uncharacterized membrane protein YeaQ/YmgE (transglycosylase-associated protein family)